VPDSSLALVIDGNQLSASDLSAVVEVVAEEAADMADALSVAVAIEPGTDGKWSSLLDPLVTPRTAVTAAITNGSVTYHFDGRSTEAIWDLNASGRSQLTIKAIDRSLDMDSEEKVVAWPGNSDSTIAAALFSNQGFSAQVDDTSPGPDPDVHVVVQRGSDWAFLRAMAAKWGYAAFLESDGSQVTGHFRALDPLADPQVELALGFGGDAEKVSVQARLTAGQEIEISRLKALSDSTEHAEANGDDRAQGKTSLAGMTTVLLAPADVIGEIDVDQTALGVARQAAFAATLTAEIDVATTGKMLRAKRTVLVKGLGDQLSGRYLVQRVRHHVTTAEHHQEVTLVRNALGLTGSEPFGQAGGLLGSLTGGTL
jgi:phage protein D